MSTYVVQCGGAPRPKVPAGASLLAVRLYNPKPTATLQFWNITHTLLQNLSPTWLDLLEIAAYVYIADTECSRWSERDALNRRWRRDFRFTIPVQNRALWSRANVRAALVETLQRVTGDTFRFKFTSRRPPTEQLVFPFEDVQAFRGKPDAVSLLSGGADSLVGAMHLIEDLNLTPVLVSHCSVARLESRQRRVHTFLKAKYGDSRLGHVSLWLHRKRTGARETTQRSRGFLFLALATVVAKQLRIPRVFVPENGPVSINVRKLQQSYSTTLSQTTYPAFLASFERLANVLGGKKVTVTNPFVFETKAEVLGRLRRYGAEAALEETVSCAHTQGQTAMRPHCGVCSQCVDRRFASAAAGLQQVDPVERYELDIFRDEIPEGEPRMQVEGHMRLSARVGALAPEAIPQEYPTLLDAACELGIPAAEAGEKLVDLLCRLAREVQTVLTKELSSVGPDMLAGRLPPHCAIRLAANAEHLRDLPAKTVDAVTRAATRSIPLAFQTREPQNEREVQDVVASILRSDPSPWLREGPLLPFTVVMTKPDFSQEGPRVFIEVKYPKVRERLNSVVTEITSRITIYRQQDAAVLFLVYDPNRTIPDDERFVADICAHERVFVTVVR